MNLLESLQLNLFTLPKPMEEAKTQESLENLPLPVEIKRKAYQRRVSFTVNTKGVLVINANQSLNGKQILKIIKPHMDWILSQKKRHEDLRSKFPCKVWRTGEEFFLNGKPLTMNMQTTLKKKASITFKENSFEFSYPFYWEELDRKELHSFLHKNLIFFFKKECSRKLEEKVSEWSLKMDLHPAKLSFRNQKSRWGSCSSTGNVTLNWKIGCMSPQIQDYVIIHELAHLKHQDHSRKFWDLVEVYCPKRRALTSELYNKGFELDCFLPTSELYESNPKF